MRVKFRGAAAAALLMMGLLAGCGDDDSGSTGGENASGGMEKATITLAWHALNKERIQPLVDRFNESQSVVTVKPSYLPYDQYTTTVQTQLQSGSAPDVFTIAAGNAIPLAVWPVGGSGKLLDLSDEPWVADLHEESKELMSVDGKTFGLPLASGAQGIFYDVGAFNELGVKPPTQFSEVLAMCEKIAAAGKVPIAMGFADTVAAMTYFDIAMVNNVYSEDPDWTEQRNEGKVTFAGSKGWRRVYDQLEEMKDAKCFPESPQGLTDTQAQALFAQGDAVMFLGAASNVPAIQELSPESEFDGFNLPPDDAANAKISLVSPQSMVASAETKYPEQVKAFFDFAAQIDEQRKVAAPGGGVLPEDLEAGKVPDYMQGFLPLVKQGKYMVLPPTKWPDSSLLNIGSEAMVGLFTGQSSVDEIIKQLDVAWDEAIAKQE